MVEVFRRPYSEEEKQALTARRPTVYQRFEDYTMMLIFVVLAFLSPLLLITKYYPISSQHELYSVVLILLLAVYTTNRIRSTYKLSNSSKHFKAELDNKQADIIHVKTNRAVEREDPEDFGAAFYIDVSDHSTYKTFYIQGQYLDELTFEKEFPNTEFIVTLDTESREILDIEILGVYFEPEIVLPAFDKKTWESGNHPYNGDFLHHIIEDIIED